MPEPEVILITGTRKGIGRHLAEHFLRRGALVEGCSRKPPEWQAENYTHHLVDVADEAQVRNMLASIQKRHGRLEVAINNAGTASMNHALLMPVETASRIMDVNFRGTFLVSRESAKLMQRRRYGRIVNFGSVAVPLRLAGEAVYAAAKSAIVTLTQVLARELAEFGITVNVVGPGPTPTDMIRGVPAQTLDRLVERMPVRRLGSFEDVANVVGFFLRPESAAVTDQVIYLGGIHYA